MLKHQGHGCKVGEGNEVGLLKKQLALRAMQASLSNHLRDASHWHSSPACKRRPIVHLFSFHMPISHPRFACPATHGTGISKGKIRFYRLIILASPRKTTQALSIWKCFALTFSLKTDICH